MAIFEAAVGLARIANAPVGDALALVERFLAESKATITGIDHQTASLAVEAFDRFGKGRHPASLNMGDCFAYACAKSNKAKLLYKGVDFAKTDLA